MGTTRRGRREREQSERSAARPPHWARHLAALLVLLPLLVSACDGVVEYAGTPTLASTSVPSEGLHFLVIGDWGRNGGDQQEEVADEMGDLVAETPASFVISTGDNFYPHGVESVTDRHWRQSFEAVYSDPGLQVPWYVVLGNHDYEGNAEAQVAFTNHDDRWRMPSRYFSREVSIGDTTEALFVYLDTTPIHDEPESEAVARQIRWLDSTLTATDAAWRLVVGHHPLYSVGDKHGNKRVMIDALRAIFERHGVQAYLSGHAHSLQHLKPEGSVHYFISGAGSRASRIEPRLSAEYASGKPGFMSALLTSEALFVRFVDDRGEVAHTARVSRWSRR